MNNPWRAQVNQKLYFAQLLLNAAPAESGAAQQAQLEGAIFQLGCAYRLYLKEIAQYQSHPTDAATARIACEQFAAQDWTCQEMSQLAQLEQQGQWPARLQQALQDVEGVAKSATTGMAKNVVPKPARQSELTAMTIAIADISDVIDVSAVQQWLVEFQHLIGVQRNATQEW